MAEPEYPKDFTERLRRLEQLVLALLLAESEAPDKDRGLYRSGWEHAQLSYGDYLSPDFEFTQRLIGSRRRIQYELDNLREEIKSLKRLESEISEIKTMLRDFKIQLRKEIGNELSGIRKKFEALQIETHSLLAIQALGLPVDHVQSIRFVPVRAYIDTTPPGAIDAISTALQELLVAFGFLWADEFPAVRGSWFKKWFAKSKEVLSQPEVLERLKKLERAVEIKAIDSPQADVDDRQASAIAKLIKSLEKVPNAAVQAGSVLVVKVATPNGSVIQARSLSQGEMLELENNQLLLQEPQSVLYKLTAACSSKGAPHE